jgi:hypothetical protein
LREFVVLKELTVRVGHDELVGCLAIRHGEPVVLVVFHEADDFKVELLPVRRLDVECVAKLDFSVALCVAVLSVDGLPPSLA